MHPNTGATLVNVRCYKLHTALSSLRYWPGMHQISNSKATVCTTGEPIGCSF